MSHPASTSRGSERDLQLSIQFHPIKPIESTRLPTGAVSCRAAAANSLETLPATWHRTVVLKWPICAYGDVPSRFAGCPFGVCSKDLFGDSAKAIYFKSCMLAYLDMSHFTPWVSKLTFTRYWSPRPSASMTNPLPNFE